MVAHVKEMGSIRNPTLARCESQCGGLCEATYTETNAHALREGGDGGDCNGIRNANACAFVNVYMLSWRQRLLLLC